MFSILTVSTILSVCLFHPNTIINLKCLIKENVEIRPLQTDFCGTTYQINSPVSTNLISNAHIDRKLRFIPQES